MEKENKSEVKVIKQETVQFQFKAKANEYFLVWIVNVALTLLMLGEYSA